MRADLGKDDCVTIAVDSAIWGAYGQFINGWGILPYFLEHGMIVAVRLKIIVQQFKYQALTVYQTIGRAIMKCSLFNWGLVKLFASKELDRYTSAMIKIGNKVYYGYSKNLNAVISANFRY